MTGYEIYELNTKLQCCCKKAIQVLRCQNYYRGMQFLQQIRQDLDRLMSEVIKDNNLMDAELQTLFVQSLQALIQAQETEDYVLLADVLELQLLPDLNDIQTGLRQCLEHQCAQSSIWENNINCLKNRDLQLAELLEQIYLYEKQGADIVEPTVWLEPTNVGAQTLASRDEKGEYYFHSNIDPYNEAWQFANWYYRPEKREYHVYGLGLGYHVEALSDMDESISLYVYERDLHVICSFMQSRNQSSLLENQKVTIIYDPDLKQFAKSLSENAVIVIHHPSLRCIKQKSIRERMEYLFIRDSGIRNQHNLMVSNFRENVINCNHNVDELYNEFRGRKAVIVAAGPSLEKNIEELKKKTENVLIISTGTVFHKLMELGIDVDFVIVSDAQPSIRNQFYRDFDKKVPLLVLSTASKCVAAEYAGEKYIIYQKDYDLSEKTAREKQCIIYETGGSVSTTALDVCLRLGCESVAYIGLDLAYTGKRRHAEGLAGVEEIDISGMRIVPGYELIHTIEGYEIIEKEVASSHLFDMYRQWIEKRVQKSKIPVFDATQGGSIIKGLSIISIYDYMKI